MTDATRLRIGLEEYLEALRFHMASLREHHGQMATAWGRLRDGYQGRGAEAFGDVWMRSDARFREYIDASGRIQQALARQIEELRRFDSASEPEL
jgi:uncharacterized protein YukE